MYSCTVEETQLKKRRVSTHVQFRYGRDSSSTGSQCDRFGGGVGGGVGPSPGQLAMDTRLGMCRMHGASPPSQGREDVSLLRKQSPPESVSSTHATHRGFALHRAQHAAVVLMFLT